MKNILLFALISVMFACSTPQKKELDNVFYCFNNGVRTLPNAPVDFEEQAKLIKNLGFDGLSGHISEDYFKRRAALDKVGLKMPEIYWGMSLFENGKVEYNKEIRQIIKDSKNRDLLVALYLPAPKQEVDQDRGDELFAEKIRELADFAAPYNVKIAIYPHVGNFCETSVHSVNLAKLVERENVGVIFNTCHLLKVEGEEGWEEKALAALPYLYMVSINGADSGDTRNRSWDKLIQPLGEGSFDTYKLVK
ncbi:MAG: TIM barrel protein, partial [Prolixibacteraceae bacterium]|nr:TIM barrel protein [Prolixibacteraceae bacterium]